jgi:hypothetical protein
MRRTVFILSGALILMAGAAMADSPTLLGTAGNAGAIAPGNPVEGGATEVLQVGDYVPELGIGCSNGAGTSGGPNDLALGVVATTMPATFYLESVSYNLFTQISPTITSMQFAAWNGGGASPGATAATTSVPFNPGFNTVALSPRLQIGAATAPGGAFYMGLHQTQSNVGFRAGVDNSSGSAGTSFIRAPTCGAASFITLDAIGYPGNWVIRAVANTTFPVELMTFEVYDDVE